MPRTDGFVPPRTTPATQRETKAAEQKTAAVGYLRVASGSQRKRADSLHQLTHASSERLRFIAQHFGTGGGPALISIKERIDSRTPACRLMLGIADVMACWELDTKESGAGHVSDRVRFLRLARGLAQAALGRAAYVTGQTIANIETSGMVPKIDTVEYMTTALGASTGCLASAEPGDVTATIRNEIVT